MDAYITLDIGGTNIRCAVFLANEIEPFRYKKIRTHQAGNTAIENIKKVIRSTWPNGHLVRGISATAPGSIDVKKGIVILAPNIPGWKNIELRDTLVKEFSVEVFINNDARLAALGEWKHGAGKGHENLLYFTISTGLGGGAIVHNQLLEGSRGIGTEMGHITLVDDGPVCGCGKHGHLEALSSGTGIENFVKHKIQDGAKTILEEGTTSKKIAEAAVQGDQLAIDAFERAAFYLGKGIANYLHIFNPSCLIFGGGVSQSGDLLFKPFERSLREYVLNKEYLNGLEVKMAMLGDNAGLIGALEYLKLNL